MSIHWFSLTWTILQHYPNFKDHSFSEIFGLLTFPNYCYFNSQSVPIAEGLSSVLCTKLCPKEDMHVKNTIA